MCGGGGGGDGGAAKREAERQKQIQLGYENIKRIFDGYNKGVGEVTNAVSGQTYYDAYGNQIQYTAPAAGAKPTAQVPLFSGTEAVPGFDNSFYDARAQEYQDFATPQLDDQYSEAVKKLTLQLSRAGILDSSARSNQFAKLQKDYNLQKTGIVDKAQDYANQARSNVEGARTELVNMNAAMADPTMIATEAQNRLASLKASPNFEVLAPLFTNVGEGVATQADLERRQSQRYNTGMFTPSYTGSGSSRSIG